MLKKLFQRYTTNTSNGKVIFFIAFFFLLFFVPFFYSLATSSLAPEGHLSQDANLLKNSVFSSNKFNNSTLGVFTETGNASPSFHNKPDTPSLSRFLAPLIRMENLPIEKLKRSFAQIKSFQVENKFEKELIFGAEAFLLEDYQAAEFHFNNALLEKSEDIYLPSFLAATALGLGATDLAEERFIQALVKKSRHGLSDADISSEQLGLALSLFMLGRTEEALPFAQYSWDSRTEALGAGNPDSILAANRLAAINVALRNNKRAEEILKMTYVEGIKNSKQAENVLAETRLLLGLILDQAGRHDELKKLSPLNEEKKFRQIKAYDLETLNKWRSTASDLLTYDKLLAADLRYHIFHSRMKTEQLDPSRPEIRQDLLYLLNAYISSGQYKAAEAEAAILLTLNPDKTSDAYIELAEIMVLSLEGQNRLNEAELLWQQIVLPIDQNLSAAKESEEALNRQENGAPASFQINESVLYDYELKSLTIHQKISDLILKESNNTQEAELELRAALARLDKNHKSPEQAEIYLRLGKILWDTPEQANHFYNLALETAYFLDKPGINDNTREAIMIISRKAKTALNTLNSGEDLPSASQRKELTGPALASPSQIQNELEALEILGRLDEFEERLRPILIESARIYGKNDKGYMAYYLLQLKFFEISARIDELTLELRALAQNPPGRTDVEKILNSCSALIYAAEVNEKNGRLAEARELYRLAVQTSNGWNERSIASRRVLAERALSKLAKKQLGTASASR